MAADDPEQVVKFVRDSTVKLLKGLHLLSLPQSVFYHLALGDLVKQHIIGSAELCGSCVDLLFKILIAGKDFLVREFEFFEAAFKIPLRRLAAVPEFAKFFFEPLLLGN